MSGVAGVLAAALAVIVPVASQDVRWQVTGIRDQWGLTDPIAVIGDRDGDGFREVAVTASVRVSRWIAELHTFVLSGKDGRIVSRVPALNLGYRIIDALVPAGDIDGDGVADYARRLYPGVWQLPHVVEVRSGKTDRLLWSVVKPFNDEFGTAMIGDIDVDGDGLPDLVVSAGGASSRKIYAYDHRGRELFRMPGHSVTPSGLAKMGDLDKDGCDDFLVHDATTPAVGEVRVHSGRTRQVLLRCFGQYPRDRIGSGMMAGCGDIDGDGVIDLVASSAFGPGVTIAFSGRNGKPIHVWREAAALAVLDMDLDGVHELINGVKPLGTRHLVSLRTGEFLAKIDHLGYPIAVGPSSREDVFPTLIGVEAQYCPGGFPGQRGRITSMRGAPAGVRPVGVACAGTARDAPRIGFLARGSNAARIHVAGAAPGAPAFLLVGTSTTRWAGRSLPLSLGSIGLPSCRLWSSADVHVSTRIGRAGLDRGLASVGVPRLPGIPLYGQWLVLDPVRNAPGSLTSSMRW